MEASILFGNGFNRCNGCGSWDDLLKEVANEGNTFVNIPNTLRYEGIYLGSDEANGGTVKETYGIKKHIADKMAEYGGSDLYRKMGDLPITNFMTTNYDNAFLYSLADLGYEQLKELADSTETMYSIHRCKHLIGKESNRKILWQIHGEIKYPRTINLGYDQYCGQLRRIVEYVNGNYECVKNGVHSKCPSIRRQYIDKTGYFAGDSKSWIDLFFFTDVHIVSFGMPFDEIDLWWILDKRARYSKDCTKGLEIKNRIYFYGDSKDVDSSKMELFRRMDVTFVGVECKNNDYEEQLSTIIDKVGENINARNLG